MIKDSDYRLRRQNRATQYAKGLTAHQINLFLNPYFKFKDGAKSDVNMQLFCNI